jgi:hypothetical protein
MIVLSAVNAVGVSDVTATKLRDLRAGSVTAITGRLRAAIETGELPPSVDAEAIASYYVTVQQGMSIQARDGASRQQLEEVVRAAMAGWELLTAE